MLVVRLGLWVWLRLGLVYYSQGKSVVRVGIRVMLALQVVSSGLVLFYVDCYTDRYIMYL